MIFKKGKVAPYDEAQRVRQPTDCCCQGILPANTSQISYPTGWKNSNGPLNKVININNMKYKCTNQSNTFLKLLQKTYYRLY